MAVNRAADRPVRRAGQQPGNHLVARLEDRGEGLFPAVLVDQFTFHESLPPVAAGRSETSPTSDNLADLILQHRLDDFLAELLAANQRLGEVPGLFHRDVAGHGRLVGIDDGLDEGRAG